MNLAPALRQHVTDLLLAVGPDAPTLCEGWKARDLAAHLVVRDRRPDAMPGILVPALAGYTKKVQDARAQQPFDAVVDDVRTGPGRLNPMSVPAVNEKVNLVEYTVHAEDVRRAQTDDAAAALPPLPSGTEEAIWAALPAWSKLTLRTCPVGVSVRCPGYGDAELKAPATDGGVTLVGSPVDVLMHLSGRRQTSRVTIEGPQAVVDAFERVHLGM